MTERIPPLVAVRVDQLKPDDIVFIQARNHMPVSRPAKRVRITGWTGTTELGATNGATFQALWDLDGRDEPRGLLVLSHHGYFVAWGLGTVLSQAIVNLRHGHHPLLPGDEVQVPGEPITVDQLAALYGLPSAEPPKRYSLPSTAALYETLPLNGRASWGKPAGGTKRGRR